MKTLRLAVLPIVLMSFSMLPTLAQAASVNSNTQAAQTHNDAKAKSDTSEKSTQNVQSQAHSNHQSKRIALNKPSISETRLLVWANTAAVSAFSYNFENYREAFQQASEYFTPQGWQTFESAFKQSGNLDTVLKDKLVVSSVATGAPVIMKQGVEHGVYSWTVQMPMLVEYQSSLSNIKQNLIVTMQIIRSAPFIGEQGIAIRQFVAKPKAQQHDTKQTTKKTANDSKKNP